MRQPNVFTAGLACAAFVISGCGPKPSSGRRAESLPTATVRAQTIERHPRIATEEVVGTVRARLRAVIEAKVSGKIDRMLVVPGQKVKRGELLASIEAHEVQARLEQALAVRQQADGDLKRDASLLAQNIIAQSQYDAAQSKFRVADATVREAEHCFGYTKVEAPFDGTITRRLAGCWATWLPPAGRSWRWKTRAATPPPGSRCTRGRRRHAHTRRSAARPALRHGHRPGGCGQRDRPRRRPWEPDVPREARSPRHAQSPRRTIRPRGHAVGGTSALRIPASAVVLRGQMELVFVVSEGKARLRIVKTGERVGDAVEVVSGVEAGETLVIENASDLVDGQLLEVR